MAINPKELHMQKPPFTTARQNINLHRRETTPTPRVNAEPDAPQETPARLGQHARRDDATDRQLEFIRDLIVDLGPSWTQKQADAVDREVRKGLTKTQAGDWITRMVEARRRLRAEQREASRRVAPLEGAGSVANTLGANARQRREPDVGMYRTDDGTIYRVYLGQKSGRNLVKRLVDTGQPHPDDSSINLHSYEYVGLAQRKLPKGATRLSLAEAKEYGRMSGSCCRCGRRLDVPESVENGIGPVCAGKVEEWA